MPIDPPPPAPDPEIVVDGIRQKIDLGAQQASFLAGLTLDYIRNSLLGGGGGAAGESNNRDGKCNVPQPDGSTPSSNARAVRNAVRTAGSVARTSPLAGAATYGALAGAWLAAVVPYSVSDYKRQPGGTDSMGNVNYGATGSALGIPLNILLRAAGGVQAPNPQNQGHPCDLSPNSSYGDRPRDQDDIKAGAKC